MTNVHRNRISVDIYGQQYIIMGSESPNHIRLVASLVNDKMREINSKNPNLDVNKLAVLTAVNAVSEFLKMKDELEQVRLELQKEKD
ncbi:cell division protein ZapA [Neobacillus dielmonensis]|uniref:cell division protein ZapA n=1 Tax=Neobacillus dielmonensis TaxID=1347369 RepID=UPI0005A7AC2B|nr:cell division protein ZapA [Neobacillus dielmonensis]